MKHHAALKIASLMVLLAAVFVLLLPTEVDAATSGKYTYTVSSSQATITDCDTSISGKVTIPSSLGGYPVVAISNYAFSSCVKMTSVTIPDSVTRINGDAFSGCTALTSATIPGSVTRIGDYAFYNCTALTNVIIAEGVAEIGICAFRSCALTSITLPSTITEIDQQAFNYSYLTKVYFKGTELQWGKITIHSDNSRLTAATVYCATAIPASNYPESAHNYANNLNESKTFTWPGASVLMITFDSSTFVENNYDYIYVYDSAGTQLAKYTGSQAANVTLEITGDSFTIKLTSDNSGQKYGYAFSSIVAYTPRHKEHPLCGTKCSCSTSHSSSTWTPWDGTTKLYSGNYYLTKDVVLDSTMILDYSYITYLCLNGHTITCEDTVFYIYSYRSLLISDCCGTGKIESTGTLPTIRNNRYLSIWGGTIVNTGSSYAVEAFNGTTTYVCKGTVQGVGYNNAIMARGGSTVYIQGGKVTGEAYGMYLDVGSKVYVQGGILHGGFGATSAVGGSGTPSQFTVSGGRVTSDSNCALEIGSGSFTMTGGYVEGLYTWNEGETNISGGTIEGYSSICSDTVNITGGTITGTVYLNGNTTTISDGTFGGKWEFNHSTGGITDSLTVTGGNFADCDDFTINLGNAWICGGSFSKVTSYNGNLYLSGVPTIEQLVLKKTGKVSAQDAGASGSFSGDPIEVLLDYTETNWKDGDLVIKNVKSEAVAEKFVVIGDDSRWASQVRSGNNLVLRVLPHGTWGDNVDWYIENGVLTISGTGELTYTYSGNRYPWGSYVNQITAIVVEPGITKIPEYAFEYCEYATTITLPETVTSLGLNAFNDCGSLNNLLLPASLEVISGSSNSGYPAFIRCESLTDVYFHGTQEQWLAIPKAENVTSANSTMTMHFLQRYESDPTCEVPGAEPHYRFDDNSVYDYLYDVNGKPIENVPQIAALGHSFTNYLSDNNATCLVDGTKTAKCDRCEETDTLPDADTKLGHSFTNYVSNGDATCVEDGTVTAKCDRCEETDTLPDADTKLGHSYTSVVTAPTCTEQGYTTYTCHCGYSYGEDYVAKLGHSFTSYMSNDNATCVEDGTMTAKCDRCEETDTQVDVGSHWGHNFANYLSDKNATCLEDGTVTAKCEWCDATDTQPDVDSKLGHSFVNYVSDGNATCLGDGTKTAKCDRCEETDTQVDVDSKLGHSFVNYVSNGNATCLVDGTETAKCDRCDVTDTRVEAESKLGHSFTNYVSNNDAACVTDGTKTAKCDRCDATDTQTDENTKLGHSFTDYVRGTESNCIEDGTLVAKCDRCEVTDILTEENTKLGHSFTNYVSDNNATCLADGTVTAKCDRCEETDTLPDEGSKLGHSLTNYVSDGNATCLTDGTKTAKCDRCSVTNTRKDVGSKLGHSFTNYVSDGNATCLVDGTKTAKCDRCEVTDVLPDDGSAKGHDYESVVTPPSCTEDGYTTYTCHCGDTYIHDPVDKLGHEMGQWVTEVEPTATEDGSQRRDCSRCDYFETEVLEATGQAVGDVNGDNVVTDADALYLLRHTLFPVLYPISQNADFNGDNVVTDADALYLLRHSLFPTLYPLQTKKDE